MNTYFSSDQHYFHKNICSHTNRPFASVEEMNEALIANHNAVVKPSDEVFYLGDFSFADDVKTLEILSRLNGNKSLIVGNHDRNIMNNPSKFIGGMLFKTIDNYKEIKRNNQSIVLFHYGMRTWNKAHHNAWHCYGHSHGNLPSFGKSVDVGVDAKFITNEYRPIAFDELKVFMDAR